MSDRRQSRIPQPRSTPLFIVVGLPKATEGIVKSTILSLLNKPAFVISPPATSSDSNIYNESYVAILLKSVVEFVSRRRDKQNPVETPSFVFLLYVPTKESEGLLRTFDCSVFPCSLDRLGEWSDEGKLARHKDSEVLLALKEGVQNLRSSETIAERLRTLRSSDALLLPPANYEFARGRTIGNLYKEMLQGTRSWNDRFPEIQVRRFNAETLPGVLSGSKADWFFQDCRNIVFAQSNAGSAHGYAWQSDSNGIDLLKGLYRFGAPLPQGFQHDAQFEGGRPLDNVVFNCCRKGEIQVTGSHVNIYPNDFVRPTTSKK